METNEDSCDSLPYIDDVSTGDETTPQQYNLKISEAYQNKNRDIEITNRSAKDIAKYFAPEEPQANEPREPDTRRHVRSFPPSGMKLVIKGCNSSISIQGLDNKSSITLRRRCDKAQKKDGGGDERPTKASADEAKPKRRRWKMLTKSLMLARSARFERRGMDERYPKYVLLKNEDDDMTRVKENYPKMFVFNERKPKGNSAFKTDFNLKKSFKNKTEPIVPLEEILTKPEDGHSRRPSQIIKSRQKHPLTDRCRRDNKNRTAVERNKIPKPDERRGSTGRPLLPQAVVCGEIQGIFEDTLKLLPQNLNLQKPDGIQNNPPLPPPPPPPPPPHFYHFSCQDRYCCLGAPDQPPNYIPKYVCKNTNTDAYRPHVEDRNMPERDEDLDNLPFGFLSGFFPRVVIMNTIRSEDLRGEESGREGVTSTSEYESSKPEVTDPLKQDGAEAPEDLPFPLHQEPMPESKEAQQPLAYLSDASPKESSDEELKTKTQESEATTEYLQYSELNEPSENEATDRQNVSTPPPRYESKGSAQKNFSPVKKYETPPQGEETFENLSLTKIGYKMYDNLTKLSLNRDRDAMKKPETTGCGCNGNEAKKSPCNITFESNNRVLKVTVPENELNFQIVNSLGADIQIGVRSGGRGSAEREQEEEEEKTKVPREEQKKIVRKEELWHSDGGGGVVGLQSGRISEAVEADAAFQKVKVSLADNKAVVLSIEMTDRDKAEDKTKEKRTKEMKVGTDDFNLAGGDFDCSSGGSRRNLSPRIGRLLKHLHEKLESDERDRKFLDEKINQKLLRQETLIPGVFLVKHISPKKEVAPKAAGDPAFDKMKKSKDKEDRTGQLREYYCEDCLATLRIFEDQNPSVKSMVDKFETIIQLESF